MAFLLDTNILLRSITPDHAMNAQAVQAILTLKKQGEKLYIVPQNLIEFWNVCTRPLEKNGLGLTVAETSNEINQIQQLFPLLLDIETIYAQWIQLVISNNVIGVNVHDAHLVAAMLAHNLTHILTFNTKDFMRYQEIIAIHPNSF
jgi:predicted nucleic acid-binding protein